MASSGSQAGIAPRIDVAAQPEARQRWQVVRSNRRQRVAGIFVGVAETAVRVPLEVQQPIAHDSERVQRFADFVGHRAQVLADDRDLLPHAFERQDAEQIPPAVAHVGAFRRVETVGNPVQAEEAHHVIDAQRASVPRVLADRFGKQPVAVFPVPLRVGRWKGPVLALGRE